MPADWDEMMRKAFEEKRAEEMENPKGFQSPQSPPFGPSPISDVQRRILEQQSKYQSAARDATQQQKEILQQLERERQEARIQALERENSRLQQTLAATSSRELYIRMLLNNLLEGMKLDGVTAPGYEEAVAFIVQEKMLVQPPIVGAVIGGGGGGGAGASGTGGVGGNGFIGITYGHGKP